MSTRAKGFAAVMVSAVFFGLIPLFVRSVIAGGGNSFSAVFYRFFLSLVPLYIYLKVKKVPLKITKNELKHILLITVCGYGGTAVLLFTSYNYIPSGMATTVHFVYPVFVILGSILFLKEKVRPLKLLCVALCMVGILLFYNGDGTMDPVGIFFAFASGITYAFYIIYLDQSILAEMDTMKLIFYMNSVASLLVLAGVCTSGMFVWKMGIVTWGILLLLAMGAAFIGVCFFQKGVHVVGPQNAAILSTFEPITSLLVGAAVYHETFTAGGMLGCLLILFSVVIVGRMKE